MDEERAVPRRGCPIVDGEDAVGEVTSGTYSPTLERGHRAGLGPSALAAPDTAVAVDVRGRAAQGRTPAQAAVCQGDLSMPAAESYPDDLRYHREHDWAG